MTNQVIFILIISALFGMATAVVWSKLTFWVSMQTHDTKRLLRLGHFYVEYFHPSGAALVGIICAGILVYLGFDPHTLFATGVPSYITTAASGMLAIVTSLVVGSIWTTCCLLLPLAIHKWNIGQTQSEQEQAPAE